MTDCILANKAILIAHAPSRPTLDLTFTKVLLDAEGERDAVQPRHGGTFYLNLLGTGYKLYYSLSQNLRDVTGVHTCDKRRTKTYIHTTYPEFCFEPGFTEVRLMPLSFPLTTHDILF
jgi:hypothetical protein